MRDVWDMVADIVAGDARLWMEVEVTVTSWAVTSGSKVTRHKSCQSGPASLRLNGDAKLLRFIFAGSRESRRGHQTACHSNAETGREGAGSMDGEFDTRVKTRAPSVRTCRKKREKKKSHLERPFQRAIQDGCGGPFHV